MPSSTRSRPSGQLALRLRTRLAASRSRSSSARLAPEQDAGGSSRQRGVRELVPLRSSRCHTRPPVGPKQEQPLNNKAMSGKPTPPAGQRSFPQQAFQGLDARLGFALPEPGIKSLVAALLAETVEELQMLAEAGRQAAADCPQTAPLVEALGEEVTRELSHLEEAQAGSSCDEGHLHQVLRLRGGAAQALCLLQEVLSSKMATDVKGSAQELVAPVCETKEEQDHIPRYRPTFHEGASRTAPSPLSLSTTLGDLVANARQALEHINTANAVDKVGAISLCPSQLEVGHAPAALNEFEELRLSIQNSRDRLRNCRSKIQMYRWSSS